MNSFDWKWPVCSFLEYLDTHSDTVLLSSDRSNCEWKSFYSGSLLFHPSGPHSGLFSACCRCFNSLEMLTSPQNSGKISLKKKILSFLHWQFESTQKGLFGSLQEVSTWQPVWFICNVSWFGTVLAGRAGLVTRAGTAVGGFSRLWPQQLQGRVWKGGGDEALHTHFCLQLDIWKPCLISCYYP